MSAAYASQSSFLQEKPLRERIGGIAIAVAVNVLLILMLLHLAIAPVSEPKTRRAALTVVQVPAEKPPRPRVVAKQHQGGGRKAPVAPPARKMEARAERTTPPQPTTNAFKSLLSLSPDEVAMTDKALRAPPQAVVADSRGSSKGHGEGPDSDGLYPGDWYRRPTDAETSPYMPHVEVAGAWGEIACRTAPHYHVEECRELGEYPTGSGISRGMREASFQFLIRPTHIGTHDTDPVGLPVRIRFYYILHKAAEGSGG